jgi:hypothetical protein
MLTRLPDGSVATNDSDADQEFGLGPGLALLRPAGIAAALMFGRSAEGRSLGRDALLVEASPMGENDADDLARLARLGTGGDTYALTIDKATGILLRTEARSSGEPFRILEATEVALGRDLSGSAFSLLPEQP